MKPRRQLTRPERYASVILQLRRGNGEPVIDPDWAKTVGHQEIIDRFEAITHDDHRIPRGMGGSDHVSNMQPLVADTDHKEKTKVDVRAIAKSKRIEKEQQEFRRKMLAKTGEDAEPSKVKPKRKIPSRPMPCGKSSGLKKTMAGEVVKRAEKRS